MHQEDDKEIFKKSREVLRGLNSVCLRNQECLYLANSRDLLNLIISLNLVQFYPAIVADD